MILLKWRINQIGIQFTKKTSFIIADQFEIYVCNCQSDWSDLRLKRIFKKHVLMFTCITHKQWTWYSICTTIGNRIYKLNSYTHDNDCKKIRIDWEHNSHKKCPHIIIRKFMYSIGTKIVTLYCILYSVDYNSLSLVDSTTALTSDQELPVLE